MLVRMRTAEDLGEASCGETSGVVTRRGEVRRGEASGGEGEVRRSEASGATHKDNVPGARHWILNEILAAGCRALYERQNSSAIALADTTCPVLRNR